MITVDDLSLQYSGAPLFSKVNLQFIQKRSEKYLIEIRKGLLRDHVNIATR